MNSISIQVIFYKGHILYLSKDILHNTNRMEAIEALIKVQEQEMSNFWKHNSQSNPGAHFEFREMRKELAELRKERDELKKLNINKRNPDTN